MTILTMTIFTMTIFAMTMFKITIFKTTIFKITILKMEIFTMANFTITMIICLQKTQKGKMMEFEVEIPFARPPPPLMMRQLHLFPLRQRLRPVSFMDRAEERGYFIRTLIVKLKLNE